VFVYQTESYGAAGVPSNPNFTFDSETNTLKVKTTSGKTWSVVLEGDALLFMQAIVKNKIPAEIYSEINLSKPENSGLDITLYKQNGKSVEGQHSPFLFPSSYRHKTDPFSNVARYTDYSQTSPVSFKSVAEAEKTLKPYMSPAVSYHKGLVEVGGGKMNDFYLTGEAKKIFDAVTSIPGVSIYLSDPLKVGKYDKDSNKSINTLSFCVRNRDGMGTELNLRVNTASERIYISRTTEFADVPVKEKDIPSLIKEITGNVGRLEPKGIEGAYSKPKTPQPRT